MKHTYTQGMYSGSRGVIMIVACACQKLSTSGNAMKNMSLAVPASSAPTHASTCMRRCSPCRHACARASAAHSRNRYSPITNEGCTAHFSAGLVKTCHGRCCARSQGASVTRAYS